MNQLRQRYSVLISLENIFIEETYPGNCSPARRLQMDNDSVILSDSGESLSREQSDDKDGSNKYE